MEYPPISPFWSGTLMACWWLFLGTFIFCCLHKSGVNQAVKTAKKSWVESSWPHCADELRSLVGQFVWRCICVAPEIMWDKIYSSADMSLTGIKRWKASVLTYWTAPFCPAAAPLPRIDDCNCPFAASQSPSCKYSNGAYAGAPQNPDS